MFASHERGILSDGMIRRMAEVGMVKAPAFVGGQVQPASLDLRLGEKAYRVRASFLPGAGVRVASRLKDMTLHEFSLAEGAVLETGCVYVVELQETLALTAGISATANPKSSTGRLDVFTRVLTDGTRRFDSIASGYHGPLYAEVSPRTFPVLVRKGSRLSQIRFRTGQPALSDVELVELDARTPLTDGKADLAGGLGFSVDLRGEHSQGRIGYRARRHAGVVDVDAKKAYAVEDFWDSISARADGSLVLDPDEFYILASKESVRIPPDYAAEMGAVDLAFGEFRVHYAGFFDPGFGCAEIGGGARAVLEVRSREVPFIIEHGQTVGRLTFERMLERPQGLYGADGTGSSYAGQGLKLGKNFR
jgi:dCTP deaminase